MMENAVSLVTLDFGVVMGLQPTSVFVFLALCCIELVLLQSSSRKFHELKGFKTPLHQSVDESNEDYSEGDAVVQFAEVSDYETTDYDYRDRGYKVQFQDPSLNVKMTPLPVTEVVPRGLKVRCGKDAMTVLLPADPPGLSRPRDLQILGNRAKSLQSVLGKRSCGYSLVKGDDQNTLTVPFNGCHVTLEEDRYTLRMLYPTAAGKVEFGAVTCPDPALPSTRCPLRSDRNRLPTSQASSKCLPPVPVITTAPTTPAAATVTLSANPHPVGCTIPKNQRVRCGALGISSAQCLVKGCCLCHDSSACFYPMDECTADKHFVFAIHHDITTFPVNPTRLVVAGGRDCEPVIVNSEFAIFRFSVTGCGTLSYVIGETDVYVAEIQTVIQALNLRYGIISRDAPIRVMVECRYQKTKLPDQPTLASVGYLVMSPSLPSSVTSDGLFGVQLRIAQDKTYSKFYPQYHQALNVLLGKPVYLELRLKSAKPVAVLLVNYCLAYTRSAKKVLILLYEGCPNRLDSGATSILYVSDLPQNRHQRRFEVKAFQFMNQSTNRYLDEEIYFMCSTEICMPSVTTCRQTCFDGKVRP